MSKDKHKLRNWPAYNEGLKRRGSLTLWLDEENLNLWELAPGKTRGGQRFYSNVAIETCLVVRQVYNLPLRQTEGMMKSILKLAGIKVAVPNYSTLCRRSNGLKVNLCVGVKGDVTDIVADSTGLKVYGEGEWKVRKHGTSGKHRTWMKLHIAIDIESQQIEAVTLTTNAVDDATEVKELLEQVDRPVRSFRGDGAYDKDKVRKVLHKKGIKQIIPPQKNAVLDKRKQAFRKQRDEAIQTIAETGREEWKKAEGYHQRSKGETVMFRYKATFGGSLAARKIEHQKTEVALSCKILNKMLQTTKPESVKVA